MAGAVAKKPRACVACHVRKVGCDASTHGIPCARCVRRKQSASCVLAPRSSRRTTSNRAPAAADADDDAYAVNVTSPAATLMMGLSSAPDPADGDATGRANDADTGHADNNSTGHADNNSTGHAEGPIRHQHQQQATVSLAAGDHQGAANGSGVVTEEDCHLRICQEMSACTADRPAALQLLGQTTGGRELIEYYGGDGPIAILGEVLAGRQPRRVVRIVLEDQINGLDPVDAEYLRQKGAFTVPGRASCDALLRLYFEHVYPHAPVLQRQQFCTEYVSGHYSMFLMQSLLANVVPYASDTLLREAGYSSRSKAQRSFFLKAKRLYDFGCEKSQLRLLQGSIMLSSLSFSYGVDYDYRFWFNNAVRIATQMGLHRGNTVGDIAPSDKLLLRRIWWVLYYRDITLVISGQTTLRRIRDSDFDTARLQTSDYEHEATDGGHASILPDFPMLQKTYLVQACHLAIIQGQFLRVFRRLGTTPTVQQISELEADLLRWRKELPTEMHADAVDDWSSITVWVLVLLGISFRFQSVLYRAIRKHHRNLGDAPAADMAYQRQQRAMFELGTTISRIAMHGLARYCPLSLPTCTCTLLAMRVEMALDAGTSTSQKWISNAQIQVELEHLRECSEYWSSLKWTLRMFEVVLTRKALLPAQSSTTETRARADNDDFLSGEGGEGMYRNVDGGYDAYTGMSAQNAADFDMLNDPDFFSLRGTEDWLQDFLD